LIVDFAPARLEKDFAPAVRGLPLRRFTSRILRSPDAQQITEEPLDLVVGFEALFA
jgi:hypothetical protein